jgi:quinolinate synthase
MQSKLIEKINELRKEKNAVILAHNYQMPEIQAMADILGDSLEMAVASKKLEEDLVVFAGVTFMAEMTAILNPEKKVVIPATEAQCPMAAQLPASEVRQKKKKHPGVPVVLYVNTLAEAKAEADTVCTSANAPQIVNALDEDTVLFGPDWNLGWFVQQHTGKKIIPLPDKGYCYVHRMFSPADIAFLKEKYPDAEVLAHPECDPEVQKLSTHVCSTSQMLRRAKESSSKQFIIATEVSMLWRLKRDNPSKEFIPALKTATCQQMKKNTLQKLYEALRDEKNVVKVPPKVAEKARASIERMFELTKKK